MSREWWMDEDHLAMHGVDSFVDDMTLRVVFRKHINGKNYQLVLTHKELAQNFKNVGDVNDQFYRYARSEINYRHEGPTNEMLLDPAIAEAWDAYLIICKLKGRK